jgi:hypothetical protein
LVLGEPAASSRPINWSILGRAAIASALDVSDFALRADTVGGSTLFLGMPESGAATGWSATCFFVDEQPASSIPTVNPMIEVVLNTLIFHPFQKVQAAISHMR